MLFMDTIKQMFKRGITQRILVCFIIAIFLYISKNMIDLFLLTFLFTYLIYSLHNFIVKKLENHFKINHLLITVLLYLVFVILIIFAVYKYFPLAIREIKEIILEIRKFELDENRYAFHKYIASFYQNININDYLGGGTNYLFHFASKLGKWGFNIFAALVLSLFFMIEKNHIENFIKKFKTSKISWMYDQMEYIGTNFLNSFGKVFQAQILIAFTNSILSIIALSILRFPHLLGLGVMIFIFSLIPVAGTIISLIPLSIIAFNIGGIAKVVYVIAMVAILHGLESYLLNPKFMSDKTHLPVFFIFIILIVSEHLMGIWGLLIGIPLFIFLLDILDVNLNEKS